MHIISYIHIHIYIYTLYTYSSPITSYMFWCLLHRLWGDHCVICSETICFLPWCYISCVIECNIYPFLKWVPGILAGGWRRRCLELTILPPSCADCLEDWEPQLPWTLRACTGLFRDCFLLSFLKCTLFVAVFKITCSGFLRYRRTKYILY